MKVPWLHKTEISKTASAVLCGYQNIAGFTVAPPIPVEDIVERYFNLRLGYMDFEEILGLTGILGATYIKKRLICVNEKLLNDGSEGRLNYTIAHEIGHWRLHRHLVLTAKRTHMEEAGILCRSKDAKLPIEWQADYFAACLLMPENTLRTVFHWIFGPKPMEIHNVKGAFEGPLYFDPCAENWHLIAEKMRKAGNFLNVSKQAMIIRLQDLGLVKNTTDMKMGWKASAVRS